MLKELEDEEILNYLMTSEFTEGLTPDEFKFLLYKFRYFYRLSNGKNELLKTDLDGSKRQLDEQSNLHNRKVDSILAQKADIENKYNFLKVRKLSWKERFSGKIIINEDENQ